MRDPTIDEYMRDPNVRAEVRRIEARELEQMTPLDHERAKYGKTEEERKPARRVRVDKAQPDDFAAAKRGEVELVDDVEDDE